MDESAATFLVCGLILTAMLVWGLATGQMISTYGVEKREQRPFAFWTNGAVLALLSAVCFYMAATQA